MLFFVDGVVNDEDYLLLNSVLGYRIRSLIERRRETNDLVSHKYNLAYFL